MADFSNTTTKGGYIQKCEALCLIGDGGITGDATLLKQFTSYINTAYYEVWMAQLSVDKQWKRDDYNYTDLPDAPITLFASQSDYSLPVAVTSANTSTFLRLNGVYYTDSTGVRIYLRPMESDETLMAIDGVPVAYQNNGKSIRLNVQPSSAFVTQFTNLHVEFQRVPDAFLSTDTIQQAGFLETYHDLLPLKASAIYLLPVNPNLSAMYEQRFLARLELFKRDIANMDDSVENNITSEFISFR